LGGDHGASARGGRHDARMTSTTLTVELECDSDPVRGTIVAADGSTVAFIGWIELAAALEAARSRRNIGGTGPVTGRQPSKEPRCTCPTPPDRATPR
jgi:hypothetical protein